MTWHCLHLGAPDRGYCYCGHATSHLDWLRARTYMRMVALWLPWDVERDASGQPVRMWWRA